MAIANQYWKIVSNRDAVQEFLVEIAYLGKRVLGCRPRMGYTESQKPGRQQVLPRGFSFVGVSIR